MYSSNAQPTGTNRPRACLTLTLLKPQRHHSLPCTLRMFASTNQTHHPHSTRPGHARVGDLAGVGDPTEQMKLGSPLEHAVCAHTTRTRGATARVTAAIAKGKHPVPSRTRKLSLSAPMVLQPRGCGRVGRRRTTIHDKATPIGGGLVAFGDHCAATCRAQRRSVTAPSAGGGASSAPVGATALAARWR